MVFVCWRGLPPPRQIEGERKTTIGRRQDGVRATLRLTGGGSIEKQKRFGRCACDATGCQASQRLASSCCSASQYQRQRRWRRRKRAARCGFITTTIHPALHCSKNRPSRR